MKGRILFYNSQTGLGKLILESEIRMDFSAQMWCDFDAFPKPGAIVACDIVNGMIACIKSVNDTFDKAFETDNTLPAEYDKASRAERDAKKLENVYNIRATFSVKDTIKNYFKPLDTLIGTPPAVVNTQEQLDYFLIKRFLFTAYNDLKGLDTAIHNSEDLKKSLEEIEKFQKAYSTVQERLDAPKLAFEIIFLRSQPEYLRFIKHKEHCLSRISILSKMEESLFPDIKRQEEAIKNAQSADISVRNALENELKSMRGYYVDTIHENASLYEELSTMEDLKDLYTDIYMEPFLLELSKQGGSYQETLSRILNYRAYTFDQKIWSYAENSKMIQEFFAASDIEGNYSTLTFLKYYLKTLDKNIISDSQKGLFELLGYLEGKS